MSADVGERQALSELEQLLNQDGGALVLVSRAGQQAVELPDVAVRLLRGVVHHLARGRAITYLPSSNMLTTQQAAEILNVSRTHVVKLLEQGEIPFERVTTHRRIKPEDLLAYKRRRDAEQERHLTELARVSNEIGLYDDPIRPKELEE
jgi:excisionase family DNA binding protein